ncbi:MAG: hypothetical protein PHX08_08155 [Lachnospiraceae bacterium]|nr:hypothetical protein [Lachnospiraceae bacterium]
MTQPQASAIFNEIWETMKQYGFEKLNTEQFTKLLTSHKCDKYDGQEKILYTKLYEALGEYYGAIEREK